MITLRDYQQEAVDRTVDYICRRENAERNPLVVLPTGCHAAGTRILMFDGSTKPVEDVAVGDEVMGPDSRPRTVLQLCRGRQEMFQVTPKKGESFVVNADHVLSLYRTRARTDSFASNAAIHGVEVRVGDIPAKSKTWRHIHKLRRVAVDFPNDREPEEIIDPWLLGALLGDGYLRQSVSITTPDAEILDGIREALKDTGMSVCLLAKKPESKASAYSIRCRRRPRAANLVRMGLEHVGAWGKLAADKFVPEIFKRDTRRNRLEVLAGLIDTDGHCSKSTFDYISKSERLAKDVVFLARSVGLAATMRPCEKFCQTGGGGTYYRVCISGDTEIVPCRVKRKQAPPRRQKKNPLVTGFDVEPVGVGDFYGFRLDGDHLYLTDDFVVHHNSGKSHVCASLIKHGVEAWRGSRWIMATHVKELIEQNMEKVLQHMPGANAGIYCAGLKRRDTGAQVTGVSIQSVYRRAAAFGRIDGVIVDEAHLIPKSGEGMYRTFLGGLQSVRPGMKVIGLTATPYRMKGGMLHKGKDRMFHDITIDVNVLDLIRQGYLAPLVGKAMANPIDVTGVGTSNGDFKKGELEQAAATDELVEGAADEMVRYGSNRTSWLAFACGVGHAEMIRDAIRRRGVDAELVTGETPKLERATLLERFKARDLRCLVNVGVLTTGFDAPVVDLLAVLRPTKSPGLYVQIAGRGLRQAPGKDDCLFLDFGGNIERHGPINLVRGRDGGGGGGEAPVKVCPDCNTYVLIGEMTCPECGYKWEPGQNPVPHSHDTKASALQVIDDGTDAEFAVRGVSTEVHVNLWGKPPTLRVTYDCDGIYIREWVPFETARHRGEAWWRKRGGIDPIPSDAYEAADRAPEELAQPSHILARKNGKYWEVRGCRFAASKTA